MRTVVRPLRLLGFLGYYLWQLVLSNLRVAHDVVRPSAELPTGILRIETAARTPLEQSLLANAITMTPGTLTLEVEEATGVLYVHTLYAADRDAFTASIRGLERRLLEALR
ncbi:cation transporter [Nitriliruptoraceae bacterium ZYF776]|nr:cation transporter [Profundirhabdus halotolerans]